MGQTTAILRPASYGRRGQRPHQRLYELRHSCLRWWPVAIIFGAHGDRPHCIYRGFCIQGCKVGAKASSGPTSPTPLTRGRDPRQSHGRTRLHRQEASYQASPTSITRAASTIRKRRVVIVRRLRSRDSATAFQFGMSRTRAGPGELLRHVGKYLMVQIGNVVAGRGTATCSASRTSPPSWSRRLATPSRRCSTPTPRFSRRGTTRI